MLETRIESRRRLGALFRLALTAAAAALSPAASAQPVSCAHWVSDDVYPGANAAVRAFASFDDGSGRKLVLAGDFTRAGDVAADRVVLSDGDTFVPLQGEGNRLTRTVNALAAFDDGSGISLYAAGLFDKASGSPADFIARWDGSAWVDVGGGLDGEVHDLAVFDDGSGPALYAAGTFVTAGGIAANRVARWDGNAWSPLANGLFESRPDGPTRVRALESFDDGSGPALYAAGSFVRAGAIIANSIARWDGATWSIVGGGVDGSISALAVYDGTGTPALFAGGSFTAAGGVAAANIAVWDGVAWLPVSSGTVGPILALTTFDTGTGRLLFAGGLFDRAGSVLASNVATWNGRTWAPLGIGTSGRVFALRGFDFGRGPRLFVGGDFTGTMEISSRSVCAWTGANWEPYASSLGSGPVALSVHDSDGTGPAIYAGGQFSGIRDRRARFVAKRQDDTWVPLGEGVNAPALALASLDDGTGSALYAGGDFSRAGGVSASRIARWRDGAWSAMGTGLPDTVRAIGLFDDGTGPALHAVGRFAGSLARWDGASWRTLGGTARLTVNVMTPFDDGSGPALYVGGSFAGIGGRVSPNVIRWDGTAWSPVGGGIIYAVNSMIAHDDGSGPALFVGGGDGVKKWDGTVWSVVGNGVGSMVNHLTTMQIEGASVLVAAGNFERTGSPLRYIAYWDGQVWAPFGDGFEAPILSLTKFSIGYSAPILYVGASVPSNPISNLAHWDNPCWTCRVGSVNAGVGAVTDVLFVNDSTGGNDRIVETLDYVPFTLFLAAAPATQGDGRYALYVWRGAPDPLDARVLPHGIGLTCMPTPLSVGSPRPIVVWNNTGNPLLGAPTHPSSPAPTIVLSLPRGLGRRGTFFLQGVIADPGSAGDRPASVTNGITLISR